MQLRDTVKTQLVNFPKKTILVQELHYSPLVLEKSSCLSSLFIMDASPIKCENKKILTFEGNILNYDDWVWNCVLYFKILW